MCNSGFNMCSKLTNTPSWSWVKTPMPTGSSAVRLKAVQFWSQSLMRPSIGSASWVWPGARWCHANDSLAPGQHFFLDRLDENPNELGWNWNLVGWNWNELGPNWNELGPNWNQVGEFFNFWQKSWKNTKEKKTGLPKENLRFSRNYSWPRFLGL